LDRDDDSGFLFEPMVDRRQALAFSNGSSYLRPKGPQLTSFGGGFFPTPLSEAVFGQRSIVAQLSCIPRLSP